MLFFRDEEQAAAWCAAEGVPRRPPATLAQLWQLSAAWYSTRLVPGAPRPGPDDLRRITAAIGLEHPFWDPLADRG